jgi:hypothetical protein
MPLRAYVVVLLLARLAAADSSLPRIYLTAGKNGAGDVHLVGVNGKDALVGRNAADPQLAPDGSTAGFIAVVEHSHSPDRTDYLGGSLILVRKGRRIRRVEGAPFVRSWQFWEGGRQVAVYFGAHHGQGWYQLLDVESGKPLGSVTDRDLYRDGHRVEVVPAWAARLAR